MASTPAERHPLSPKPETSFAQEEAAVVAALETDADQGLTQAGAAARLSRNGPDEMPGEKPPSVWEVAVEQLREPMTISGLALRSSGRSRSRWCRCS